MGASIPQNRTHLTTNCLFSVKNLGLACLLSNKVTRHQFDDLDGSSLSIFSLKCLHFTWKCSILVYQVNLWTFNITRVLYSGPNINSPFQKHKDLEQLCNPWNFVVWKFVILNFHILKMAEFNIWSSKIHENLDFTPFTLLKIHF